MSPFSLRRFLREYWERKPLFVHREERSYFANLLSFRDLDSVLASNHRLPGLRLVKAKTDIAIQRYASEYTQVGESLYGTVDIDKVFAEHQAGEPSSWEGVHRTWGPLSQFCREVEVL